LGVDSNEEKRELAKEHPLCEASGRVLKKAQTLIDEKSLVLEDEVLNCIIVKALNKVLLEMRLRRLHVGAPAWR